MKKILIVDDDPDVKEAISEVLVANGFSVETAENSEEGYEKFLNFKPDLVILDLIMETYDAGFVLAYKIKKENANIPIILVTSVNYDSQIQFDLNEAKERQWIKADYFIDKPVNPSLLLEKVNLIFGLNKKSNH